MNYEPPEGSKVSTSKQPSLDQVWAWLEEIEDPEIPVISIVDLGIVRGVRCKNDAEGGEWVVTITPTYSGCPATHVIARSVIERLAQHGLARVRLETSLAQGLVIERAHQNQLFASEDVAEGLKSFLEKRPPQFGGR